jgi:hydroxymethylbilane synthase
VAGLQRLGMADRVREVLEPELILPAVGQGVLGIECRAGDREIATLIAVLNDAGCAARVAAERAMNRKLGGGCQVPIAGFAEIDGRDLQLRGLVASIDGRRLLRARGRGPWRQGEQIGASVAEDLLSQGAGDILAEVYADGDDG